MPLHPPLFSLRPQKKRVAASKRTLVTQDFQTAITRDGEEPWLDVRIRVERGQGQVELEPDLLQDILCLVILAHILVDQIKKRLLIAVHQSFERFLITIEC
jgi:hypothetical protein